MKVLDHDSNKHTVYNLHIEQTIGHSNQKFAIILKEHTVEGYQFPHGHKS